jgi:hypothetical protein
VYDTTYIIAMCKIQNVVHREMQEAREKVGRAGGRWIFLDDPRRSRKKKEKSKMGGRIIIIVRPGDDAEMTYSRINRRPTAKQSDVTLRKRRRSDQEWRD